MIEKINTQQVEIEKLYRFLRGETTPEEDSNIEQWLDADRTERMRELDGVRFLFECSQLQEAVPASRMRFFHTRALKYAAGIAASLLLAAGAALTAHRMAYDSLVEQHVVLQVPAGQRLELTLSDGTHLWLNSEATLEYPSVFARDNRTVKLSGEALFEVTRDTERPFIVQTFASDITVLGTKFNVNADESRRQFSTTLFEGSVRLSNRLFPNQKEVCMRPDEVVNLTDNILYVEQAKDDAALCWTQGLLSVTGLSFAELMEKFGQTFGVEIVVERKTLPEMANVGGKIRINGGIGNALRLLQYAADFTFDIDEERNVVVIR